MIDTYVPGIAHVQAVDPARLYVPGLQHCGVSHDVVTYLPAGDWEHE